LGAPLAEPHPMAVAQSGEKHLTVGDLQGEIRAFYDSVADRFAELVAGHDDLAPRRYGNYIFESSAAIADTRPDIGQAGYLETRRTQLFFNNPERKLLLPGTGGVGQA